MVRGLKKNDLAIFSDLQTYHSHVRPYLGLHEGQTPGEAAGIHVSGDNPWLTIIQSTTKFAVRLAANPSD